MGGAALVLSLLGACAAGYSYRFVMALNVIDVSGNKSSNAVRCRRGFGCAQRYEECAFDGVFGILLLPAYASILAQIERF